MEWKICPNCNIKCSIVAISSFDTDGTKYGGVFYCKLCGYHNLDRFITQKEIKELKDELEKK